METKMEVDQPPSVDHSIFRKDSRSLTALALINNSLSEQYDTSKRNYRCTERVLASQDVVTLQDHRNTLRKLLFDNEDDASNAEVLVKRLVFEMDTAVVGDAQDMRRKGEVVLSRDKVEDILRYYKQWAKVLSKVHKNLTVLRQRGWQLKKFWDKTEKMIEEMAKGIEDVAKGTDEGSNMFRQILTLRLKEFGGEEIEDILDAFVASQEHEAEEAEKARKEEEGLQVLEVLDKAREEFKDVFDELKNELEELKMDSEALRHEMEDLQYLVTS